MTEFRYYRPKVSLDSSEEVSLVLLGEGLSECLFIEAVLRAENATKCAIFDIRGVGELEKRLEIVSSQPGFANVLKLALMIDSDNDPLGRIAKAVSAFGAVGYPADTATLTAGKLCREASRVSALCLNPAQGTSGCIEDLVLDELRTRVEHRCIDTLLQCLKAKTGVELSKKAIAQIFVSTRANSGLCGLGRAFLNGMLDVAEPAYDRPRSFILDVLAA